MASAMRKMAVYLGLVEDDSRYDEQYQDEFGADEYEEYGAEFIDQSDSREVIRHAEAGRLPEREPPAVTMQTTDLARITTLHPRTYNEARTIGEHFREGTPVIINLTEMVDSDARRLVDFSAGPVFCSVGASIGFPTRCSCWRRRTSREPPKTRPG